jgi:type III restriction enzyme
LNDNFNKKEFQELWSRINQRAAYTVHFEAEELVDKCVRTLDKELKVTRLTYTVQRGQQNDETTVESLSDGEAFIVDETETFEHDATVYSAVRYDLIGKLAEDTQLTRGTIGAILQGVDKTTFDQYRINPEDFILKAGRLINEQKATVIVEHLAYDPVEERH